MTTLPSRQNISVKDYLHIDRESQEARYEYIDGRMRMLAGGTLKHPQISANIVGILYSLLRGTSCIVFTADARVRLSEKRYVYPDVTVSCDSRDRGEIDTIQYPSAVFEVLSPSTESYDRDKKFSYYRACPILQEYVLVNSQRAIIEVFMRKNDHFWLYRAFSADEEVELASIHAHFSVADVYEHVVLPSEDEEPTED